MRTFADNATLKTLSLDDVRKSWYTITAENELLRFDTGVVGSANSLSKNVPTTMRIVSGTCYYAAHYIGTSFFKTISLTAPNFEQAGTSLANASLKTDITTTQWLTGYFSSMGQQPVVRRYSLAGALQSTSTAIPEATAYTSLMVRRIEAVCDLDGTNALAVVGCHNLAEMISTLKFFIVNATTAYELTTILQMDIPTTETWTAWYDGAKYCSRVWAIANTDGGYTIVANDTATGRAVQFRWRNGVESQVEPVVPIDPDASEDSFTPTGLCKINNLYYLSGYFKRPKTDSTTDRMNVYLTSTDAWNWSVGERSFFVSTDDTKGYIVPCAAGVSSIYYAGLGDGTTGKVYTAPARVVDGYGTAANITGNTFRWSFSNPVDSVDQLNIAVEAGHSLGEGDIVNFSTGYVNGAGVQYGGQVGKYVIDTLPDTATAEGMAPADLQALDYAGRKLKDWQSPVDFDRWSMTKHEDPLDDLSKLIVKTPIRDAFTERTSETDTKDVKTLSGSLFSNSLNDPLVGYTTTRDERDGEAYAEVGFQVTDTHCLQNFGFVFGGSTEAFNAVTINKTGSQWRAHDKPELWTSNLAPVDEETAEGGFNTEARLTGLIESQLAGTWLKMLKPVNATASGQEEVYRPVATWTADASTTYQFKLRKGGKRVQLYAKVKDYSPANCVVSAFWTLIAEFSFNEYARMFHSTRPYWGLCLGTDVWASTEALADADVSDIETALTDARNYARYSTEVTVPGVTIWDVTTGQDVVAYASEGVHATVDLDDYFHVGQPIRTLNGNPVGSSTQTRHITSFETVGGYKCTIRTDGTGGPGGYGLIRIRSGDTWAYAKSGYEDVEISIAGDTYTEQRDSHAIWLSSPVRGYAAFINNDNTAQSNRWIISDGTKHELLSGSYPYTGGNTYEGWDAVNPIDTIYGGSSSPWAWRCIFHHGCIIDHWVSDDSLPTSGYMRVDDELIRYVQKAVRLYNENLSGTDNAPGSAGYNNYYQWTVVPTWYTVAQVQSTASNILNRWVGPAGQLPGDAWEDIPSETPIKDLLVEISTRSYQASDSLPINSKPLYTDAVTGTDENVALYLNRATDMPISVNNNIVALSGRGQVSSDKSLHGSDTPVVYYPLPLTDPPPTSAFDWLIRVNAFDHYNGLYNSLEDDLKYTCGLAGVRGAAFKSLGNYSDNLSTTPVTVSTENVSDFVLDLKAHLYGNADNRLRVEFRGGAYKLDIQHLVDATAISTGRMGQIRLLLQAPTSDIVQGAYEAKWLDSATVLVGTYDISGTYNGSTHTEDTTRTVNLRLIVRKHLITVECEGQHVWTINLDRYTYNDGAANYKVLTPGPVKISYTSAANLPVVARLLELSSEVENHIIDMGQEGAEALSTVLTDRHIWTVTTPTGGLTLSQYRTRDDWCADSVDLTENVIQDVSIESAMDIAGHILVSGAEFGEHIDETWTRAKGYRFQMGQNALLDTVQDSRDEAKLLVRLGREQSHRRTVKCAFFPDLQPMDRLDISRPAVGTIPAVVQTGYVVTNVSASGDINGMGAQIEMQIEESTL